MLTFDPLYNPYSSRQLTTYANKGMVATTQPLAAQAGLEMLKQGGNAIDAAIATAASLTVVEPVSTSIGSDAFAMIWTGDQLHGLNASGPAPVNIDVDEVRDMGYDEMPRFGMIPVTIPGAPAAWAELSKKYGKLPFKKLLEPAIEYATEGFPISPIVGKAWQDFINKNKNSMKAEHFKSWFNTFAPEGRAPGIGEIWKSLVHANSLTAIAETETESFYKGELAQKIVDFSQENDGFIELEDLKNYAVEWVDPIKVNYRGYDVWELPPNGQGLITLIALSILKEFDFKAKETVDTYHKQIEALKLAFADGTKYITDYNKMEVAVEELLSDAYIEKRRKLISQYALQPEAGKPTGSETVYLATADNEGNMVSFIQSHYMVFGSGMTVPGTGINLQNRGNCFSLNPEDANCLAPGKKTYHTIIPGFLTKDNKPIGPFGVMGGFMQPQGHLQVLMNTIDFNLNPQAALDAPRWMWTGDKEIKVEPGFKNHIAQALSRKGHQIKRALDTNFGRGQIIWKNKAGVLAGGTDLRGDSQIAVW